MHPERRRRGTRLVPITYLGSSGMHCAAPTALILIGIETPALTDWADV